MAAEPGRTLSPGATSVEGMTDICGASDFMISFRTGDVLSCTLPTGHPLWTVNPATEYSYNHHDAERDVWWNEGGPPPGVSREDWLNGVSAPARTEPYRDGHADLCGMCGESLLRPQPRCPAHKGHATKPARGPS